MLKEVLAEHMPGYRLDSVVPAGEGMDNIAFEVNGELIVRFGKDPDPAVVVREARLLEVIKDISPVPVPEPLFVAPHQRCLAYSKIPGVPMIDVPSGRWTTHVEPIAAALGGLLTALHTAPVARLAALVAKDATTLHQWLDEARDNYAAVAGLVPLGCEKAIEAFLSAAPPPGSAVFVFSHNDLGVEHILIDPVAGEVTGVIDWSDAALVDPACDFGRLHRDLEVTAFDAVVRHYRAGVEDAVAMRERAAFYARCGVFADIAFGVETSAGKYVEKSLPALGKLFS